MSNYLKAAAAVVATVLSAIVAALVGDAIVTAAEWVNVAIAGTFAAAVFAAPNVPGARYTKSALAVLAGVLVVLNSAITDGISATEWLQMALAGLGALGVYAAPYQAQLTVRRV
jgi:hypothetical protein